ncbi:hypothetical protein CC2G_014170 [Coprinopsis cinerea AmutBmut pab1-1]|nr:hypothetical protein CC2G_014170 [Coprinopsis cinerea AmutBmut pab1-1]
MAINAVVEPGRSSKERRPATHLPLVRPGKGRLVLLELIESISTTSSMRTMAGFSSIETSDALSGRLANLGQWLQTK